MVRTGSLEGQTLALLWEVGLGDFTLRGHWESWRVMEQKVLAELGFEKTNLEVCWQDPQRGWSQGSSSLYLS